MNSGKLAITVCGILLAAFAGGCLIIGCVEPGIAGNPAAYPVTDSAADAVVPAYVPGITLNVPLPASPAVVPYYRVTAVLQNARKNSTTLTIKKQIPSVNEAPVLAIQALEPYGGLPSDAVFERSEQVFMKKFNLATDTVEEQYPQYTQVTYRQYVNGSPVMNSRISISLGENGELLEYSRDWYVLEPDGEIPVISAQEALEKLKEQDLLFRIQCSVDGYTITRIQSGYYIIVHSPYVQEGNTSDTCIPVWIFYGIKPGTGVEPFPFYINATRG